MGEIRQVVVRGLLIRDDKVLLVNVIGHPHFFVPGGRLEEGETVEAALRREIKEELGVDCRVDKYLGSIEHSFEKNGNQFYELNFVFMIVVDGLNVGAVKSNEDHLKFKWFSFEELGSLDVKPESVKELIKNYDSINSFWDSTIDARNF